MRVRFAPSPTGYLHVGGARTALFNWLMARQQGGSFVLRIEDTDRERSSDAHTEAIVESLTWLGLDWDEGPVFQSDGADRHRTEALELLDRGLAFRDFTTPEELARAREEEGKSGDWVRFARRASNAIDADEAEERAAAGEPHAIRFRVPDGETVWDDLVHGAMRFDNDRIDDLVILRSDQTATYNLAVVSDDSDMWITHVVRGDDHLSNTPKQVLLYEALGRPVPAFGHVPLILGPDGRRLSKRHGATALGAYRDEGFLPEALVNFLALLGWSPGEDIEVLSLDDLITRFSIERVNKKGAVFDKGKLEWLNGRYLSETDAHELEPLVTRVLLTNELLPASTLEAPRVPLQRALDLVKSRARTVVDLAHLAVPYVVEELPYDPAATAKQWFKDPAQTSERLSTVRDRLEETEWSAEALEQALRSLAEEMGIGAGKLIHPLRVALTGRSASPGIFEVLVLLGSDLSIDRLNKAITMVMKGSVPGISKPGMDPLAPSIDGG